MGSLNAILNRIPIITLTLIALGYMGYQTYEWFNSSTSELGSKIQESQVLIKTLETTKVKVKLAEEFSRSLETLKSEIKQLSAQLENSKNILSAEFDVGDFVSIVTHEAKKLGIIVKGIAPEAGVQKEFYVEVPFRLLISGAYVQMLVFFDRISKLTQIVKVADFDLKSVGNIKVKYVPIAGSVKLVAYRYFGAKEEDIKSKGAKQ